MQRRNLKSVLAQHHFLEGLARPYLDLLTGCAANVRFAEEQFLFHAGQEADLFFLIRQGRVRIELPVGHRSPVTVQTVGEGEVLGWSWLIPPYRWHFSARALEPVVALSFDGKCIRGKFETDHSLGYELFRRFAVIMSARLEGALLQLVGLCG